MARFDNMRTWAEKSFSGPLLYVFWKNNTCWYVGKGQDVGRLKQYKNHRYIKEATLLKVYPVRGKSYLSQVECIAIHLFNPRYNEIKAQQLKGAKHCPICSANKTIKEKIKAMLD